MSYDMPQHPVQDEPGCFTKALWWGVTVYWTLVHLYTVVIAFLASGIDAALLTFIFPILSMLYWFFWLWQEIGLLNLYTILLVGGVLFWGFAGLLVIVAEQWRSSRLAMH